MINCSRIHTTQMDKRNGDEWDNSEDGVKTKMWQWYEQELKSAVWAVVSTMLTAQQFKKSPKLPTQYQIIIIGPMDLRNKYVIIQNTRGWHHHKCNCEHCDLNINNKHTNHKGYRSQGGNHPQNLSTIFISTPFIRMLSLKLLKK